MKKLLVVAVVAVLVALAATPAMALVANSKHDMTATAYYSNANLSSCQYCHTPHHAVTIAGNDQPPLWNRTIPTQSYTVYGGGATLSGNTVNQPGTHSKTCLSCHDGTIAVNAVYNPSTGVNVVSGTVLNGSGQILTTAAGYIGTDLRDDHPVGVTYDTSRSIAGLTTTGWGGGNVHSSGWKVYGGEINAGGVVECGSCHDPHNTAAGETPFLKGALLTICSDCHGAK